MNFELCFMGNLLCFVPRLGPKKECICPSPLKLCKEKFDRRLTMKILPEKKNNICLKKFQSMKNLSIYNLNNCIKRNIPFEKNKKNPSKKFIFNKLIKKRIHKN